MAVPHAMEEIEARGELTARKRLLEKVALLTEFNELLVENSGDCILVIDQREWVISINQAAREMLGFLEGEIPDGPWRNLFRAVEIKPDFYLPSGRRVRAQFQASSRPPGGGVRFWSMTVTSFSNPDSRLARYLLIARDVTEHMLAERALRQSEEAFRRLFEENPIGIVLADPDCSITRVNHAIRAMLGFKDEELAGRDLRVLTESPNPAFEEDLERLLRGEMQSFQSETVFRTKWDQAVWGHLTTSILRDAEGRPLAIFQMIENIQDRKSSEEQVLAYQEQLQSLASELALSEERERRRIATNLHDRIGQSLAFARLKLAALEENRRDEGLSEVRELIEQTIGDTRSLTFELSPPVLYELGLVAGVEWLARGIQSEHGIQTRFHDDGRPKPLDENLRVVLFQAVRELLVNVVKHARASQAQVLLRREADALRVIIEDDGVGFDLPEVMARRESARSFGLFNVRERVEYLGGKVKISSEPGRGTRVTLIAPLRPQ